jgi:hypothetical protein
MPSTRPSFYQRSPWLFVPIDSARSQYA